MTCASSKSITSLIAASDAKEPVDFYKRVMNMDLLGVIAEDRVPSTEAPDPYMHILLDAGAGNILAFFDASLTSQPSFRLAIPPIVRLRDQARQMLAQSSEKSAKDQLQASAAPFRSGIRSSNAAMSRM